MSSLPVLLVFFQTRKMDLVSKKWINTLIFSLFFIGADCTSVEKKIYVHLNKTIPCVRLLNATHQIGCQSSLSGNVGILHVLESEENLDWVLRTGPNPPYMVILEYQLFSRSIMMKLKDGSGRVAGVAVVTPNANPAEGFSPHTSCPNENTGVYSESYSPSMAHCNVTMWNPFGNGLSYEEFDFPIFSMKDDNETQLIRQCYMDHNRWLNGSTPHYPLCAMELNSHMYAVTDTVTCMRRNQISDKFSLNTANEFVCDPLGDFNVWAASKPLNATAKGHKMSESVVIAAARLDSRSFFYDVAPGAQSAASGFIALLAAAHALRNATQDTSLNRTILYTFFQGETFDYIGSSRMVYDMEKQQFVVDLDNVHSLLEVGQVGLRANSRLWLHSDPVSRRNTSVDDEVKTLVENLQSSVMGLNVSVSEPNFSQPLPPSSFQRFLRSRPIPGVVIQDHQSAFSNKFYESMYDNADYLSLSYPQNMTQEEQLEFITETAKALAEVATVVARALYKQAGGDQSRLSTINADARIVNYILYSFLVQSNNTWLQQMVTSASSLKNRPTNFYVGVENQLSEPTHLVEHVLANLTGSVVNVTQDDCQKQRENESDSETKHLYKYSWVQGAVRPNSTEREGFCVRSTIHRSTAVSPAFELREYASKDYSTWTESRWKSNFKGRVFLVASHQLEMLTLGVGVGVLVTSLLLTYIISSKADILFSSQREPTNATY
ncbi:nicastrin [Nerophis ophidion]|uniref:nicastrin n=1 Tax=Nerophis ophidion TaxID=159077 RepID=UPI002ADFA6F1|nr:nicastrin [Nerophis ophidion]